MFAEVPLLLAFTGGRVATVNPCAIAMLPAYLLFLLGIGGAPAGAGRRGAGIGAALRVRALVALVAVVAVVALGVWMLNGRPLPIKLPLPGKAVEGRSTGATVTFGLGYALACLSCTLPVFLAVVAGTATRESFGAGVATFAVYAVGMALPLLVLTLALAIGRDALVQRVRRLGGVVTRAGGALLLVAGLYIVLYWATQLAGVRSGVLHEAVVVVERASASASTFLARWGVPDRRGAGLRWLAVTGHSNPVGRLAVAAPVVGDGAVILDDRSTVTARDLATDEELWRGEREGREGASAGLALGPGGTVAYLDRGRQLVLLD